MVACIYVIILILQAVTVKSQNPATLSVTNVIPGATATFECSLPNLGSSTSMHAYKNNVAEYACTNIAFTCSKISSHIDYSDITFTDLGTVSAKGTFTVSNADHTRDGGDWRCQYGTSSLSSTDTFLVRVPSLATFSVINVIQGATATFECSYPNLESPTSLDIYKNSVALYQCTDIASTCSKSSTDTDYSDVSFTDLDTASAKGTFTVANAEQTRDGGDWKCKYGTSLISSSVTFVVSAQTPATLSVTDDVKQGATATFECSYPSLTSPTTLDIYKDNVALYQCTDIASTCSKSSTDSDYSEVSFMDLGTASAKGTFTVAHADETRDGGEWTCKYGTSLISPPVNVVVNDYCSWCCFSHYISCWLCILIIILIIVLIIVIVVGVLVIWWFCCRRYIGYMTIEKVTQDSIKLRWSIDGLHPQTPDSKAICRIQPPNVCHKDDGTHTVNVQNVAPDTIITIYLEFTNKDGTLCKEILMEIQTIKDHIRAMTIQKVTHDTILLWCSMHCLHPRTIGLNAICEKQHPRVCHEIDGTHTVTVENLAPDTNNTIYLEYTDKDGARCKEIVIQIQTMKAPTEKPKGLPPLERGSAAAYTPRHGHDGEETHNTPGPLPPINKFTGIPESSDGHNTRSHSITDKDSLNCKVHVQD